MVVYVQLLLAYALELFIDLDQLSTVTAHVLYTLLQLDERMK